MKDDYLCFGKKRGLGSFSDTDFILYFINFIISVGIFVN